MNEVTTAQMKELERLADAAGLPYLRMMENAGTAAARGSAAGATTAATGLWRRAACKTPVWR